MNKRIKKKLASRMWYETFKKYKEKVGNPYKEYLQEQKRMKKNGKPKITTEEMQDLIDLGFYTEDEIHKKFNIVKNFS